MILCLLMIGTIEKWLQEGEVELSVTRINMHGASGSGKTCTQLLLLNEPPPPPVSVTDSTPIACPAVQATRISIDNHNEKMKWKKVTAAELVEQLASDLKEAPKETSQPSVQEEAPKETKTHEQNEREDKPLHHSDDEAQKESLDATKKVNEDTGERVDEPHQSNDEAQKESTEAAEKVIEDIVKKIPHTKVELHTNWAYFIDSGGQPAYRELLPLFSRTAALNIIAIDLTKGLDKECEFEHRIGGENLPIYTELKYSNLDIIRSTISSEATLKPIKVPYVTTTPSHPHYLIIGTRKDSKEVKKEDIESMNEKLIGCNFDHVIQKKNGESIIFPVDTLLPDGSNERKEASMELCKVISNRNVSMKIKMPIRLFLFEISLQKDAEEKKRSFLTIEEVVAIGKRLQLNNEEEVVKALQYLHNVTIILYYPDALSGFVFVDPQPILDILSQLIAITYVDPANLRVNSPPSQKEINYLHTRGCFKEDLLQKVNNQFEPHHMIKLLLHLHIIAELENGDYFFPCALPSYNEKKIPPPSTEEIKPLLVVWKNDDNYETLPVPQGMFPLIVVHLLNQKDKVDFPPSGSNYHKCHNAMSLKFNKSSTFHIINHYNHIELYFEGNKKDCPKVWGLLDEAIKNSSNDIYVQQSYIRAFKCPKNKEENCYCIEKNKRSTYCTRCRLAYEIPQNDESYWCWISDSQPGKLALPSLL